MNQLLRTKFNFEINERMAIFAINELSNVSWNEKPQKKCLFMQFLRHHSLATIYFGKLQARLAQSVEHQTFNLRVAGSSPSSGGEIFKNGNLWKHRCVEEFRDFSWFAQSCIAWKRLEPNFSRESMKTKVNFCQKFLSTWTMENNRQTIAPVAQSVSASYL